MPSAVDIRAVAASRANRSQWARHLRRMGGGATKQDKWGNITSEVRYKDKKRPTVERQHVVCDDSGDSGCETDTMTAEVAKANADSCISFRVQRDWPHQLLRLV